MGKEGVTYTRNNLVPSIKYMSMAEGEEGYNMLTDAHVREGYTAGPNHSRSVAFYAMI